jgi:predicted Zn finger-like uncharacterized protein
MTVACPDCRSVFRVDPAKVPATGVRARCSVCGGVIAIAGGTLPVSVTPGSLGAVGAPGGGPRPSRPTPQRPQTPAAVASTAVAPPMMTPPAPVRLPSTTPAYAGASAGTPVSAARPLAMPSATPAGSAGVVAAPAPAASSAASSATTATMTPRRAINPFLNADPGQRARRLARALVSDLVAYHPQKREEGLREGTLRQLFREDIKKSYEEYVEQVGREVAEGSPHFQDALNDILGGGRRLF